VALWVRSHHVCDAFNARGQGICVSRGVVEFWIYNGRWDHPHWVALRPPPPLVQSWHGFGTGQGNGAFSVSSLFVPLWFLALLFLILPAGSLLRRIRHRRRRRRRRPQGASSSARRKKMLASRTGGRRIGGVIPGSPPPPRPPRRPT
jgi:hypothetical protein